MHLRSKSKRTHSPRKSSSSKAPESGYPIEPHITRYITRRKHTLPRLSYCTAQAAVWARRRFKSPAPWVLRFSALQGLRKVLKWPSGGGASSFRPPQSRISRRNSARDGQPRRGHHSGNARQCESLLRHETMANNGRVIVLGSRGEVTINPRELMSRRASIRAFTKECIDLHEVSLDTARAQNPQDDSVLRARATHSVDT